MPLISLQKLTAFPRVPPALARGAGRVIFYFSVF